MADKVTWYEIWRVENGSMQFIGMSTDVNDAMMMVGAPMNGVVWRIMARPPSA